MIKHSILQKAAVLTFAAAALFAGQSLVTPETATAKVNFEGQRITLIVPFKEGGGTDTYARFIAPFLARHLPGKPTIVVRNVPGAGSVTGANKFQEEAKPDGMMLLAVSASTNMNYILGKKTVKYDLKKFEPILLTPQGVIIYTSPKLGLKGPQDIKKFKGLNVTYAGHNPTSAELRQLLMFELLGMKVKPIWGLNRGPARQAYRRGETNINNDSASGYIKKAAPLVKKGTAAPIFTCGILQAGGTIGRDPVIGPNLPHFLEAYEMVHGKKLTGNSHKAYEALVHATVTANKSLHLAAGTPKDILQTYSTAVINMLKDPEFEKKRKIRLGEYDQFAGEKAKPAYQKAIDVDDETVRWIRDYSRKHGGKI